MFASVRDYVVQNLLPNYRDFLETRRSNRYGEQRLVRSAISAAGSMYHLREHFPVGTGPTFAQLAALCPDYVFVRDVWNAAKHHNCNQNGTQVSSAEQIFELLVSTRYQDDHGEFVGAQVEAMVRFNDGRERSLAVLLHNVMEMWRTKLRELGVADLARVSDEPRDRALTRAEVDEGPRLEITKGEERALRFLVRKFNYETGVAEPVDLTDSQIYFQVRKLPTAATIECVEPSTGARFDFDVPLDQEQALAYVRLETPAEQQQFLAALIDSIATIQTGLAQAFGAARRDSPASPLTPDV